MGSILFTLVMATAPAAPPPVVVSPPPRPVQVCQAWGPKPPDCIEPPLRETVTIYNGWRKPEGTHPSDGVMIRPPSLMERYGGPVKDAPFPAWLRSGEARRSAEVALNLVIGPDGTIQSCRAALVEAHEYPSQAKRNAIAADASLGEQACTLVQSARKFRPAIDVEGRPIEAPVAVAVYYKRERYEMLAPPAPPPPSRYLGTAPYGNREAWPPSYFLDAPIRVAMPKFKDFLTDSANLPKQAVVGAVIDLANTGQAVRCEVRLPSPDKRLDDATCAALRTVQSAPTRWGTRGLPVEVTWQGGKAKGRLASPPTLPSLVTPILIPPEARPAAPPKWPVRVRLLLDGQGKPASCTVIGPSDIDALDAAACKFARQGQFTPGKDGFGRPVVSGVDLWVDWKSGNLTLPGY